MRVEQAGANALVETSDGFTTMMWAEWVEQSQTGDTPMVAMLKNHGGKLSATDSDGLRRLRARKDTGEQRILVLEHEERFKMRTSSRTTVRRVRGQARVFGVSIILL